MPRSLAARITLALTVTAVAVLLAVGAALFVVLRDLYQRAEYSRLHAAGSTILAQLAARPTLGDAQAALAVLRDDLTGQSIAAYFVGPEGHVTALTGAATPNDPLPPVPTSGRGTWADAIVAFNNGQRWATSSVSLAPLGAVALRGLVFATPDRSGADTVSDLLRTIPLVALVVVVAGGGLGLWLARSTTGPLRRLAAATARVPDAGSEPPVLQPEGPTEVRELTERFNAMAAELARTRRAEQELLANLRHDLRTPLTVIGGFATALVDGTAEGETAARAARAIADEAARLDAMVDELGALETIRTGSRGLRPEPLDAAGLLADAAARFGPRASAGGIDLSVQVEPATPAFAADRLAMERIVGNLVENALRSVAASGPAREGPAHGEPARAMPSPAASGPQVAGDAPPPALAPSGRIMLAARGGSMPSGSRAVFISVSDDGPGFPPGSLEWAFQRSYRADPARSGPGSGLGLAIVRELARAHGGDALAENLAPRGARVSVVMPLVPSIQGPLPPTG